jgi:hypothetical protein
MQRTIKINAVFTVLAVVGLVYLLACAQEPSGQVDTLAMIRQAQADAAAESSFVNDSVAFERTFDVKPVAGLKTLDMQEDDDDGDAVSVPHYYALSADNKVCQLSDAKYRAFRDTQLVRPNLQFAPSDTLRCQWSDKYEQ